MPTYTWSIHGSSDANLGMNVSQSGRYLYVTILRQRNYSATFYSDAASVTVAVNGSSSQGGTSSSNAFPTSLKVGTWYNAALVNAVFDLGYGASNANVVVSWSYAAGWASGSKSYNRAVSPFYNAPAAPTGVTATRVSDTSTKLTWAAHATGSAPYTSQEAYRSENSGGWIGTAALSGSAATYTVATTANKKYTFLVQARNSAGQTNSATSNVILTTPAKLTSLAGAKVSDGIKLTFSKLGVPYSEAQVLLERTTNGGSTWSTVHTFNASDLSTSASTVWTDTAAPTGGTVQYRATVKTNGGTQGTLSAAATLSNAMTLNVPPSAPTHLTPSGLVDVLSTVILSWMHTASVDGAAQSSRQIQYSADSGATQVDIVAGNSTSQSYAWTVPTASFTAGQTVQWRVRTAGSQAGTYGAWSAWQTVTLRASLTVDVTDPSGTLSGGDIAVNWAVFESWGSASQVSYRVVMDSATGTIYDSGTVTDAAPSAIIPAASQANLTSYTITVTITDNFGLTSLPDSTLVDTDFLQPAPVTLQWSYDDDLGQIVFIPIFSLETSSALDDTTSWMLERSVDGSTWTILGVYVGDDTVSDPLCRIGADSWYRTTGYSTLGVAGEQKVHQVFADNVTSRWGRLAYGDGFSNQVRFGWSQTVEVGSGRASDAFDIEGVDFPAAVFGGQKSRKLSVTGKLLYTSSPQAGGIPDSFITASDEEMTALQENAGVCLFRDGRGSWWTCRVTDMRVTPKGPTHPGQPDEAAVSFTIERVSA